MRRRNVILMEDWQQCDLNKKLVYQSKIHEDAAIILNEYLKDKDKSSITIDKITIQVPK